VGLSNNLSHLAGVQSFFCWKGISHLSKNLIINYYSSIKTSDSVVVEIRWSPRILTKRKHRHHRNHSTKDPTSSKLYSPESPCTKKSSNLVNPARKWVKMLLNLEKKKLFLSVNIFLSHCRWLLCFWFSIVR